MTAAKTSSYTATRAPRSTGDTLLTVGRIVLIVIMLLFALFPVIWIVSASFNPSGSMVSQQLIPSGVDSLDKLFVNYRRLFDNPQVPFWRWVFNSFFVAGISTVITLMITSISAYAFSRFRFRFRRNLLLFIFLIQVFPNLLAVVALYLMLLQIGKYIPILGLNTYGGLILVYVGGAQALNIWLMKAFFDTVPRDIDESAMVDGATSWQIYWQLIVPLVRPILAVVGLLAFVGSFNEFLLARVFISDRENWTLMVGLFNFVSAEFTNDWGVFAAGALLAAVPIIVLYIFLQRYIVGGLTSGAVKG
jgi:ABC-type maltose transport system permease subunit